MDEETKKDLIDFAVVIGIVFGAHLGTLLVIAMFRAAGFGS